MIEDSVVEAAMYRCILMCMTEAVALELSPHLGETLFYKIVNLMGEEKNFKINSLKLLIDTLELHDKSEHEKIGELYNTIIELIVDYSGRMYTDTVKT